MDVETLQALWTTSSFIVMTYVYISWRVQHQKDRCDTREQYQKDRTAAREQHKIERREWLEIIANQHRETIENGKESNNVLKTLTVAVEKLNFKK